MYRIVTILAFVNLVFLIDMPGHLETSFLVLST